MSSSQQVQPLRIQKGGAGSSPAKMSVLGGVGRPLSELSPMAVRRNSPSFPQGNKNNIFKGESSPFNPSPSDGIATNSPRLFWQGRDPTSPGRISMGNRIPFEEDASPIPSKRSSIENLKKASRVKNSSIFEKEQKYQYDPAQVSVPERPLAAGRPLSQQALNKASGEEFATSIYAQVTSPLRQNEEASPMLETSLAQPAPVAPLSPSKYNTSPTKSCLSKKMGLSARKMSFDPENGIWSDGDDSMVEKQLPEGRVLHRHAKSVNFDHAPPQVNEYEMTTPDPSSVASGSREGSYDDLEDDEESFERCSSLDRMDDSFDASLEDTDKTPVVLPEDWRFMSPDSANTALAQHEEDVFDGDYGSPAPNAQPGPIEYRPHQTSVNSVDSNGQARPLPPLPPSKLGQSDSDNSISSTVERISSGQRNLPSPPQASPVSKSDIRRMSGGGFTMDDRLRLMMLQDPPIEKSEAELQRERRMRRAESKESSPTRSESRYSTPQESNDGEDAHIPFRSNSNAPRISRESILRRLQSQSDLQADESFQDASSSQDGPGPALSFDPDVAIPSREDPTQVLSETSPEPIIKQEESDSEVDLYSIPDVCNRRHANHEDSEDETSQYSQPSLAAQTRFSFEDGQTTPRAHTPVREPEKKQATQRQRVSLPEFDGFGNSKTFDFGLDTYMTPSPPQDDKQVSEVQPTTRSQHVQSTSLNKPLPDLASLRESIQRPATPPEQLEPPPHLSEGEREPGTPDSVIRHSIARSASPASIEPKAGSQVPMAAQKDSSNSTTARSSLEERPSLSTTTDSTEASDSAAQAEPKKHRVSSLVQLELPRDQSDEALGFGLEQEFDRVVEAQKVAFEQSLSRLHHPFHGRFPSSELPASKDVSRSGTQIRRSNLGNVPHLRPQGARALPEEQRNRGFPYPTDGSHFANRSPGRQRGYLMRQNTKVVVASHNAIEEEPKPTSTSAQPADEVVPSQRKISQPTWTAEPWNGKTRRRSIRGVDKSPTKKKALDGPAPPLPGQQSNVQEGLGAVQEDEIAEEEAEDFDDGAERGRLFVKVVGVKDLDLPLPRNENTHFALTLDNGLHCVTTAWLDLGRNAPIGQEFELVVLNELEFQLTLQMKLEQPVSRPSSPTKAPASPTKKQGTFGRLFNSPKKRKELEIARQQEEERKSVVTPPQEPSAYQLVQGLVAKDGSFARAYIALAEHEKQAFGRPYTVDIMCFNEWAMEEVSVGSSRSRKGSVALQARPPYPIGKLELQMLYIPKPKGAKDEDMPKSMNSAVRELREAETRATVTRAWEGHLSQQGGDCPYWRRRFFKLAGSKLTAYHEATLQPRATINLAKAAKLIDDKSALTQREISTKGGGRRKSAFAEEEEGYMFVEEGFRVRFANGEVIDFYADSAEAKEEWMKVLSDVVGKQVGTAASNKGWTEMVLKREKSSKAKNKKPDLASMPPSPTKVTREQMEAKAAAKERQRQAEVQATGVNNENIRPRSSDQAVSPPKSRYHVPTSSATRPAHGRTESYQQPSSLPKPSSKSAANSPVKGGSARMTREERAKKTRSMLY